MPGCCDWIGGVGVLQQQAGVAVSAPSWRGSVLRARSASNWTQMVEIRHRVATAVRHGATAVAYHHHHKGLANLMLKGTKSALCAAARNCLVPV